MAKSLLAALQLPRPKKLPGAAPEERFDLTVGDTKLSGASRRDAIEALARHHRGLHASVEGGAYGHAEMIKVVREQRVVAWVSEALGGAQMPDLAIWEPARDALRRALAALKAQDVATAVQRLHEADDAYRAANRAFGGYQGKVETGGDRAITGLKVTAAAGAVAAGVATGGAATAAGAGLVGTAAAGGTVAGVYGATQELAGEASAVWLANIKRKVDWSAVLRRGANDAITGFVGGIVGGALTRQFSRLFGSYLGHLGKAELAELGKALGMAGPCPPEFFMTTGQKLIAEFLGNAATVPLTASITLGINRISGGAKGPENVEEFLKEVLADIVKGGVVQLFVSFLTHHMPATRGGSAGHDQPPATPTQPPPKTNPAATAPTATGPKAAPARPRPVAAAASEPLARTPAVEPAPAAPAKPPRRSAAESEALLKSRPAANDNAEIPPPPTSQAAANDNVELPQAVAREQPPKLAAGAEGQSTEPRASTEGSKRAPKRKPYADDPDFGKSFQEHVDRPGAEAETVADMREADPRIDVRNSQSTGLHNTDKHHVFPQERRAWFKKRGMVGANDIDNFTVLMDKAMHQAEHGGGDWQQARRVWADEYNRRVMHELESLEAAKRNTLGDPKALLTPAEIVQAVFALLDQRKIPKDFVKYK
jgi:hypothetical protein